MSGVACSAGFATLQGQLFVPLHHTSAVVLVSFFMAFPSIFLLNLIYHTMILNHLFFHCCFIIEFGAKSRNLLYFSCCIKMRQVLFFDPSLFWNTTE